MVTPLRASPPINFYNVARGPPVPDLDPGRLTAFWGTPRPTVSRRTSIGHTGGLPDRSAVLRRFVDDAVMLIVLANLPQAAIDAAKEIEHLYFGGLVS